VTSAAVLLFLSACGTATLHALIPDHWLPFVVMARAQGWSLRRTVILTGSAGLLHVALSILLAVAAIALGVPSARELAARAGRPLESITGALLLLFGLAYGAWAYQREARAHAHAAADLQTPPHVHAHGHLLERWFRRVVTGGALVVLIGISPCAVLAPILFVASTVGRAAVLTAALGFALCTIGTMIAVTLAALRSIRRLDLPFLSRYGDLISGVLLAAVGVVLMVLH
jgi:hypothetical protein